MAARFDIVIDSVHPAALAGFWAAALPGYVVRAYGAAELARMAEQGLTPDTDPSVAVDGPGPTLWFQQVGERVEGRNRIHFDLRGVPREREVERLLGLGATVRDQHDDHTVLLDPEGNQFCVGDWS
jgi:hypothetical protein